MLRAASKELLMNQGIRDAQRGGLSSLTTPIVRDYGRVRRYRKIEDCTALGSLANYSTSAAGVTLVAGGIQMVGQGSWGTCGFYHNRAFTKQNGLALITDVKVTAPNTGTMIGLHDGSGTSYTDLSYAFDMYASGASNKFALFEAGTLRLDNAGSGYVTNTSYRLRIRFKDGTTFYEVQGGVYGTIGADAWTLLWTDPRGTGTTFYFGGAAETGTMVISRWAMMAV